MIKRRAVDDHHVARFLHLFQDEVHASRTKQFRRVGRKTAAGDHLQILHLAPALRRLGRRGRRAEEVSQTVPVGNVEKAMNARPAPICIQEDDAIAALRHNGCQVRGHRRLAIGRPRAGNKNGAQWLIDAGKFQVRTQSAAPRPRRRAPDCRRWKRELFCSMSTSSASVTLYP